MLQAPQLPSPGLYPNWIGFAEALIRVLSEWFGRAAKSGSDPLTPYTVATLPTKASVGTIVLVKDGAGGEVPAWFASDNTWRRVTDRTVVS